MRVARMPLNEDIDQVDQLTGLERNKQGGQNLEASGIKMIPSGGNVAPTQQLVSPNGERTSKDH